MVLNNHKSRKNKSHKNKSRKSLRGGGLGIGRGFSRVLGLKPSPSQKRKTLDEKLFQFKMWNYHNTINHPEEVKYLLRSMLNGLFGVINIQTETDVIELEKMKLRTVSGLQFTEYGSDPAFFNEEKNLNLLKWQEAGRPDPIVGDIIYKAYEILDAGQKNGLFTVPDYQLSREKFKERMGKPMTN